jgi:hypothetical protein
MIRHKKKASGPTPDSPIHYPLVSAPPAVSIKNVLEHISAQDFWLPLPVHLFLACCGALILSLSLSIDDL